MESIPYTSYLNTQVKTENPQFKIEVDDNHYYIAKLHDIIFGDEQMMVEIMVYLRALNLIHINVFDCIYERIIQKNEDEEFEYTGRFFEGLQLSDEQFKLKITLPNSKRPAALDTDLNVKLNFDRYAQQESFKNVCYELCNKILPTDQLHRNQELNKFILQVFQEAQGAERLGNGSKPTEWEKFWKEIGRNKCYEKEKVSEINNYFKNALCQAITGTLVSTIDMQLSETKEAPKEKVKPSSKHGLFQRRFSSSRSKEPS